VTHEADELPDVNIPAESERAAAERIAALAEAAAPHLLRADGNTWLARLDADAETIHAALARSVALDHTDAGDEPGGLLARLAAALWPYWWLRGTVEEGRQWLDAALERTDAATTRAALLTGAGVLAFEADDIRTARISWSELLGIGKATSDPTAEALGLAGLSLVAHRLGDPQRADALGRASLVRCVAGADRQARILALLVRGRGLVGRDDAQAASMFAEAVQAARTAGLTGLLGYGLIGGAFAAFGQSDPVTASTLADAARAAFTQQADMRGRDLVACWSRTCSSGSPATNMPQPTR
jgi:hypothetical protein